MLLQQYFHLFLSSTDEMNIRLWKSKFGKEKCDDVWLPPLTPKPRLETMATAIPTATNGQPRLFKFLLDLLSKNEYAHLVTWINKDAGEFVLNNPDAVSKKWGQLKNKPNMKYEHLSRSLRAYYDGGLMSKVQGRKYAYRFTDDALSPKPAKTKTRAQGTKRNCLATIAKLKERIDKLELICNQKTMNV